MPPVVLPTVLHAIVRDRVCATPTHTAYAFYDSPSGPAVLTYDALDASARRIAAWLQQFPYSQTGAVLAFPPGLEFIEAFWGCLYAGIVAIPVPPLAQHGSRLSAIVADSHARVILTTSAVAARVQAALASANHPCHVIDVARLTDDYASTWREPVIVGTDVAYLQYTSGSTSAPRGVMVAHANVLANICDIDEVFAHRPGDVCVSWLPHFHDMGLVYGIVQSAFCGIPAHLLSPRAFVQNPMCWLQLISHVGATHSGGPNFAYDLCVRRMSAAACERLDLSRWRVAFNGAEPVRRETLVRFAATFRPFGFREESFFPAYGLAEATLKVTCHRNGPVAYQPARSSRRDAADGTSDSLVTGCGVPCRSTVVRIVHPEWLTACAPGEIGEIWVAGPGVARGYWGRPKETLCTFGAHLEGEGPFLRTGDLGFLHGEELFVTGRLKDVVIVRGANYYPHDLEATAEAAHSAVRASCVAAFSVARDDDERLVILAEVHRHCDEHACREVAEAVAAAIGQRHGIVPGTVALIAEGHLPKTTSGKVPRYLCREQLLAGRLSIVRQVDFPDAIQAAGTVRDQSIRRMLAHVAGSERRNVVEHYFIDLASALTSADRGDIDRRRSLVSLGIDSLAAAEITFKIENDFTVHLPPALLLTASIGELAQYVLDHLDDPSGAERSVPQSDRDVVPVDRWERTTVEQERLYWLQAQSPASTAYNIAGALRFTGPLQVDMLQQAIDQLRRRHDILRTRFAAQDGKVLRVVMPPEAAAISLLDVSSLAEPARQAEALTREQIDTQLDPQRGQCVNVRLYRVSATEHILVIVFHHIVADASSIQIALHEIVKLYEAVAARRSASVPGVLPFSRHAYWESRYLIGPIVQEHVEYWRERLRRVGNVRRASRVLPPIAHAAHTVTLAPAAARRVRDFSRSRNATLFMTMMAAFAATLGRALKESSVTIGVPVSGRWRRETQNAIGPFSHPLPYVADLSGSPTFDALVASTRTAALEAYTHQRVPFAYLVHALRDQTASFRFMFTQLPSMPGSYAIDDLIVSPVALELSPLDLDLYVGLSESADSLCLTFAYNRAWRERRELEQLARSCVDLLDAGTRDPAVRIDGV